MTSGGSGARAGFVVWVDFEVAPGQFGVFLELVQANAAASVALEPGCRRFDVMTPTEGGPLVSLYEIYDDETAFKAHLGMRHFHEFDAATAPMLVSKEVRTYAVRENAKP